MNYYQNNIRHVKGNTYSCGLKLEGLGQVPDSLYFTCRDSLNDDSEQLFQVSLSNGITQVDYDETNDIRSYAVRVPPSATKDLQTGTYYYDLQIGVNYDIFTIMRGEFIVEQDATHDTAPTADIGLILDGINGEVIGTTLTDKTDYLTETKEQIRTSINNFLGNVSTSDTFRSYATAIDGIKNNNFKNKYDKSNPTIKKLNASNGTYVSSTNQLHTYIQCQPDTVYVIFKDITINTLMVINESVEEPDVGVGYNTLLGASNSNGRALIKTSSNVHYLDVKITNSAITEEEQQTIINSIQIFDMTPLITLNS